MALTIRKIEDIIQSAKLSSKDLDILNAILEAIDDWPHQTDSFQDYISQLESYLDDIPNKRALENANKEMALDEQAWNAESISAILQLYKYFDDSKTLSDINSILISKYKS